MKSIPRIRRAQGEIAAPPSKSYTARALLLAAMAEGETTILNPLDSDDSRYMLEAIRAIGFEVRGDFAGGITIGERVGMSAGEVEIFVGNAGTAMRFLAGFLAFTPGRFVLRGEERMHQRPIGDLVNALVSIGTEVEYLGEEGYPPLRMRGRVMRGGFEVDVSGAVSSQFVSSLMMAGARLPGGVRVRAASLTSRPYIAITSDILGRFGAAVAEVEPGVWEVRGEKLYCPRYTVEGDWSSASYWFAAAAACSGEVTVTGLEQSSAQGDRLFAGMLEVMGAEIRWDGGRCTVSADQAPGGGSFDCNAAPDIVPTLAAIAPAAAAPVRITNVANLRVKESDRIAVLASELRRLGAVVEESESGLTVQPGWGEAPATIDPHGDHRIAMSFAVAGLRRGGVTIADEHVVRKSYPRFWRDLDALVSTSVPV